MNKKQKEQLYSEEGLVVGFKNVLKEISANYAFDYERLDSAEKTACYEIEKEYAKKKSAVKKREAKASKELNEYLKMVEKYSTFRIDDIINVITEITSLYKGEEYQCEEIKIKKNVCEPQLLIYPKRLECDVETYGCEFINDGVVLSLYDDVDGNEINFYEAQVTLNNTIDLETMKLLPSKNSLQHRFILDFIDFVVKYRIEKQADEISFGELKKLEQLFIYEKREEIQALYNKKAQSERAELEQRISNRELLLNNYVGIYEDNQVVQDVVTDLTSGKMLKKLIESFDRDTSE